LFTPVELSTCARPCFFFPPSLPFRQIEAPIRKPLTPLKNCHLPPRTLPSLPHLSLPLTPSLVPSKCYSGEIKSPLLFLFFVESCVSLLFFFAPKLTFPSLSVFFFWGLLSSRPFFARRSAGFPFVLFFFGFFPSIGEASFCGVQPSPPRDFLGVGVRHAPPLLVSPFPPQNWPFVGARVNSFVFSFRPIFPTFCIQFSPKIFPAFLAYLSCSRTLMFILARIPPPSRP